jgi:uncharacterized Ntn-hydrolase superfamily protein
MDQLPLSGTQSIVAVDRGSGEMGAAILSQSFSIGSKSLWAEPGVGVVVGQGTVEASYGSLGLALLKGGKTPQQTLQSLLATDPRPAVRQVMMVDSRGRTAAHTGKGCLPEAGHLAGRGYSVQANFVSAQRGWRSMAVAFRKGKGELAERLLLALEAGEHASKGSHRGGAPRSAAIIIVSAVSTGTPWEGRLMDLRVENSGAPLRELRSMLKVSDAYRHATIGSELLAKGELERGGREFSKAMALAPESQEIRLWLGLQMMKHAAGGGGGGGAEAKTAESVLRRAVGRRGQDQRAIIRELVARGIVSEGAVAGRERPATQTQKEDDGGVSGEEKRKKSGTGSERKKREQKPVPTASRTIRLRPRLT